jgi:CRISPR-associated RAMP protein (TIGR02581 family)
MKAEPVPRPFSSHSRLERLVMFELRLSCRTGLHIGAGKSSDLVGSDLPVMRDADGRPIIPGSSLRGRLRAALTSLAQTLELDRSLGEKLAPTVSPTGEGKLAQTERLERWWHAGSVGTESLFVERLFGRVAQRSKDVSYASRVQISDLRWVGEEEAIAVELRDGVAIDRETRTVAGRSTKYDHEVVPAGSRFAGRVRLLNPTEEELGLVAQGLWMLDQGLALLGGKSARGLGWVQVEVTPPVDRSAREILARVGPSATKPALLAIEEAFAGPLAALSHVAHWLEEAR